MPAHVTVITKGCDTGAVCRRGQGVRCATTSPGQAPAPDRPSACVLGADGSGCGGFGGRAGCASAGRERPAQDRIGEPDQIDMARGVLMAGLGCSMEEPWETLVEVSQHSNIWLRVLAEMITASVTGTEPSQQSLLDHLTAAAARRPRALDDGVGAWRWPGRTCDLGRSNASFPRPVRLPTIAGAR
ncbi:ANTAR domain-containing protein [Streptomyces longwoodensis]|uniref:ANTAR domain-containing protein n=1 Tax=Streptomyces longwoodensis TaxID=68231 RepID=UPI0036F770DF